MKKIHLICNAHIDPIWQWNWDEGISSVISTFKSAVDLADEFDYIFCHGESLLYETIERTAPELFQKIVELVKQKKWHISGGWYLQPDCLFPAGETFVRNIAEGKRYFLEKFGVEPCVATNFDSFGHSVGLVQIMAKAGFKGYLICRPRKDVQIKYPSRFFNWVAPDGSKIIVSNSSTYNSALGNVTKKILEEVGGNDVGMLGFEAVDNKNGGLEDIDYVLWGVGNHGGGPSRKDLRDIKELNIADTEIIHSTPESLFSDNISVVGEKKTSLITCMPGCYSSMARIKQAYRKTENLYYATEKLISIAKLNGYNPDMRDFNDAEKKLLLATFHDILPGTCIAGGEKEGLGLIYSCEKIARDYRTDAFLYLTMNQPCAKEGEFPVFVFNYLPYEKESIIETEFSLADQNWDETVVFKPHVFDENGNELLCQQIKEESTLNLDWRKKIVFKGKLKPLAITRFLVKVEPEKITKKIAKNILLEDCFSLKTIINAPATLEMYDDTADPWGMSEKELKNLGENPVEFNLMSKEEAKSFCATKNYLEPVRVIENGELYENVECLYALGNSKAVVQYKFYKQEPYIDVKVILEFAEKNKLVRIKFPLPKEFQGAKVVGDGPYVWEEKPDCEVTFQKWFGAKKENNLFAIINDGVYAGKYDDKNLYITLLRGAGYCVHPIGDRELYPQDRYLPRIDCGRYEYNFRVFVGNIEQVYEQSEEFNNLPYGLNVFPVGGNKLIKPQVSLTGGLIISAVKPCADNSFVFRIFNPSGEEKNYKIKVKDTEYLGKAKAFEVISLKYINDKIAVVNNIADF